MKMKIIIETQHNLLTYTGELISKDEQFITINTIRDGKISLPINKILSMTEVEE